MRFGARTGAGAATEDSTTKAGLLAGWAPLTDGIGGPMVIWVVQEHKLDVFNVRLPPTSPVGACTQAEQIVTDCLLDT